MFLSLIRWNRFCCCFWFIRSRILLEVRTHITCLIYFPLDKPRDGKCYCAALLMIIIDKDRSALAGTEWPTAGHWCLPLRNLHTTRRRVTRNAVAVRSAGRPSMVRYVVVFFASSRRAPRLDARTLVGDKLTPAYPVRILTFWDPFRHRVDSNLPRLYFNVHVKKCHQIVIMLSMYKINYFELGFRKVTLQLNRR